MTRVPGESPERQAPCPHRFVFDHGAGAYTCWDCGAKGRMMTRKKVVRWSAPPAKPRREARRGR